MQNQNQNVVNGMTATKELIDHMEAELEHVHADLEHVGRDLEELKAHIKNLSHLHHLLDETEMGIVE